MIDGYTTWTNGVNSRCQVQWVKGYLQPCYINLFLRYNWQKVSIGSGSIPASYTWSTGTLPGPMVFTKGVKYNESKGIFNHAISTCFLGIIDKKIVLYFITLNDGGKSHLSASVNGLDNKSAGSPTGHCDLAGTRHECVWVSVWIDTHVVKKRWPCQSTITLVIYN